jgi:hypothetical protein
MQDGENHSNRRWRPRGNASELLSAIWISFDTISDVLSGPSVAVLALLGYLSSYLLARQPRCPWCWRALDKTTTETRTAPIICPTCGRAVEVNADHTNASRLWTHPLMNMVIGVTFGAILFASAVYVVHLITSMQIVAAVVIVIILGGAVSISFRVVLSLVITALWFWRTHREATDDPQQPH